MATWREVRAVDWSRYPGAYGTSRDVPAALETLRAGPERGDDFDDAVNDFLWGHVWHQGTIYPLTPKVLPFLLELLEPPVREDLEEVAEVVGFCTAAARRIVADRAATEADLAIAARVLDVVAAAS